ncbi:MAG: FAD-dependent oxidoreductase, partial [Polyangiaceae bacterium]|nr:FAD-dependent oxidoreductase [Polyangiaceae bacterium]
MHPLPDLAVVGGGIAGLVAAIEAALAGARVTLFERASLLGGRARSSAHRGFLFNQGPHALFHQGALARWLRRQHLLLAGGFAGTHPARFLWRGRLCEMPLGATALLGATWLTPAEKWAFARGLLRLLRADPSSLGGTTVGALVAPLAPPVRALVEALVRLATYGGSLDEMSAECALSQLQLATRGGVRYLDGGWQSLVDALEARARSLGVEIRTGEGVRAIEGAPPALHLRTDRGDLVPSRAVVVTGAPGRVAALIEERAGALHRFAGGAIPVRAASLDVALRPGVPTGGLVLGEDGLYLNDHGR